MTRSWSGWCKTTIKKWEKRSKGSLIETLNMRSTKTLNHMSKLRKISYSCKRWNWSSKTVWRMTTSASMKWYQGSLTMFLEIVLSKIWTKWGSSLEWVVSRRLLKSLKGTIAVPTAARQRPPSMSTSTWISMLWESMPSLSNLKSPSISSELRKTSYRKIPLWMPILTSKWTRTPYKRCSIKMTSKVCMLSGSLTRVLSWPLSRRMTYLFWINMLVMKSSTLKLSQEPPPLKLKIWWGKIYPCII